MLQRKTVPNEGTYAPLNEGTRDRSVSLIGTGASPGQTTANYMCLNEATRNRQEGLYQDISPSSR